MTSSYTSSSFLLAILALMHVTAASIFLIVASACCVLLTGFVIALCIVGIRAALAVHALTTSVHNEVRYFVEERKRMLRNARFSMIWLEALVRRWIEPKRRHKP